MLAVQMFTQGIQPRAPVALEVVDPVPNLYQGLGAEMIDALPSFAPF